MNSTVDQGLKQNIDIVEGENVSILYQLHQVQEELEHCYFLKHEYERKVSYLNRNLESVMKALKGKRRLLIRMTDLLGITIQNQINMISTSGFFDEKWYLLHYPDVEKQGLNPIEHYLRYGAKEGRNPGPEFNSSWYLNAYSDVANKEINPLLHFVLHGEKEGRMPCQDGFIFPPDPFALEREWLRKVSNEQAQCAAERQDQVDFLIQAQAVLEQDKAELAARRDVLKNEVAELALARDEQAQCAAERQDQVGFLIQAQAVLEQDKAQLAARHEVLKNEVAELALARDEQAQCAAERQDQFDFLIQAQAVLEQDKAELAARHEVLKNEVAELALARDEQAQCAAERQDQVGFLIQAQAVLGQDKAELAVRHEVLKNEVAELALARDEQAQCAAERQDQVDFLIQAQAVLEQDKAELAARVVDAEMRAKNNAVGIGRLRELADEERFIVEGQIGLIKEIILRESVVR